MLRPRSTFVALAAALACVACAPDPPEILWDEYGVPHIFAADDRDLFHMFGWAQMNNHADLILELYGQARGRAAEYWGEDQLRSDWWVRTMGVPGRAEAWYGELDPEMRGNVDAFVAGMNAWAEANADRIDRRVRRVLPIRPTDPLAHMQRVVQFTFMARPDMVPRDFGVPGLASLAGPVAMAPEPVLPVGAGSNAWAIGPGRSEGGDAMLLANPHLPWGGFFTWMEVQLTGRDVDGYGGVLVGMPWIGIGFNDHLGWTHTVNTYDGADLYVIELDGNGYVYEREHRDFDTRAELVKIRTDDGTRDEWLTIRESVHGPVVGESDGEAVALRVAGLDASGLLRQGWEMMRSRNLQEFEAALSMLQLPMFTTIYADGDGNILHVFNGRVPVRASGDFAYWQGLVPGGSAGTLWSETHPYADLPRVLNPGSGWLQNANDPPWTTTFPSPLDPADYPAYMAPQEMALRPQASARLLAADERISFAEMVAYKHDTHVEMADRTLEDLIPLARSRGSGMARNAADVLERWDRTADAESRGTILFLAWVEEMARRSGGIDRMFAGNWDRSRPLETPSGLANPDIAVSALEAAAVSVQDRYGTLAAPFGDAYRLRRDDLDLPGNGYGDPFGVFRAAWYREGRFGLREITGGDSFVAAVEFSDPVRAMAVIGYGNASQPDSHHRTDQLRLFAGKELRPVWRTRSEIEAHLEAREVF